MELLEFILYILVYSYTGFALKLIDQMNDEDFPLNTKIKFLILISSPVFAGLVMGLDIYNASVGLMLIFGLLIAKKVNVLDFKIYAVITIASMVLISISNQFFIFENFLLVLPTTLILLIAVIADEIFNNYLDSKQFTNSLIKSLAVIRPILKIIVFILPILNLFTFYHAVQVLCLDIAYDFTRYFTEQKLKLLEK